METSLSLMITFIGVGVIFLLILVLGIWTYYKLNKDFEVYKTNRENYIASSSAPTIGSSGNPGLDGNSAYDVYVAQLFDSQDNLRTLAEYAAALMITPLAATPAYNALIANFPLKTLTDYAADLIPPQTTLVAGPNYNTSIAKFPLTILTKEQFILTYDGLISVDTAYDAHIASFLPVVLTKAAYETSNPMGVYNTYIHNENNTSPRVILTKALFNTTKLPTPAPANLDAEYDAYITVLKPIVLSKNQFKLTYTGLLPALDTAYDSYIDFMNTTYTEPLLIILKPSEFDTKFTGTDGTHGVNGTNGVPGDNGEDGSTGFHGDTGAIGSKGNTGSLGVKGIAGDSFFTFEKCIDPLNPLAPAAFPVTFPGDPIEDPGGDPTISPPGYPSCAFVDYDIVALPNSKSARITYFFQGNLLTIFDINWGTNLPIAETTGYLSFIIYDAKLNIIGLTDPIKLTDFVYFQDVSVTVTGLATLSYRSIISLNKAFTMSSFTQNIIEKSLANESFVYIRDNTNDPFVNNLYTLIQSNPSLSFNNIEFTDKTKISKLTLNSVDIININS